MSAMTCQFTNTYTSREWKAWTLFMAARTAFQTCVLERPLNRLQTKKTPPYKSNAIKKYFICTYNLYIT